MDVNHDNRDCNSSSNSIRTKSNIMKENEAEYGVIEKMLMYI